MPTAVEEQVEMVTAPSSNDEGFRRAAEQMGMGVVGRVGDWRLWYDWKLDTVFLRKESERPFVTYFCPAEPEILANLDAQSGELTGIDVTDFRRVWAKKHPEFREYLGAIVLENFLALFPLARRIARVWQRGTPVAVGSELSRSVCLT